jgi:phosphate starvation-inducible PhoH-like protein
MQNSTPNQMFMLLTRIGNGTKIIITGDPMQTTNNNNGLVDVIVKLNKNYDNEESLINDKIKIIRMDDIDIQRHHIVAKINNLYKN